MRFQYLSRAQKPLLNAHVNVFSGDRGLYFGLYLHLQLNFVYVSSENSGKGRSHPIGNLHRVLPTHGFL